VGRVKEEGDGVKADVERGYSAIESR